MIPRRFALSLPVALTMVLASQAPLAQTREPVSLELILGVDVSTSIDDREYALQMRGIAEALRGRAVSDAIKAHPLGVAFALFLWAGVAQDEPAVRWRVLRTQEDIDRLADEVETTSSANLGYFTGIGKAIRHAVAEIDGNGYTAPLRRIDISGDGRSNTGLEPVEAGHLAVSKGITVNGLAVLTDDAALDRYYAANVSAGPGAFVEIALDHDGFHRAMLRKLLRELEPAVAQAPVSDRARFALESSPRLVKDGAQWTGRAD